MAESKELLTNGVAKLFNNTYLADAKIYIYKFELQAHSVVLSLHSEHFEKAFKSGFKEGASKEFTFDDGSAHAYWRVFEYMYTGQYSVDPADALNAEDDEELMRDARVYVLADYFFMAALKEYAFKRFQEQIEKLWISESFVDCIREVYRTTNDDDKRMRDAVVQVAYSHVKELWPNKRFQDLVQENGKFAVDLTATLIQKGVTATSSYDYGY
ncbi:hypothetical protein VTN02DRAFT_6039 [Thermoascus thermophilus]